MGILLKNDLKILDIDKGEQNMDLWIRSQDKMNLESVHSINVNYLNKKQIICNYEPDFIGSQGEYYILL